MRELKGQVILVTGGGSGLGAAICHALGKASALVLPADVRPDAAERTAADLKSHGIEAIPLTLDVADERSVAAAIHTVTARFGTIDALVNNAGVDRAAPLDELRVEDWDRICAVNLRGPFLLAHAVFPVMRERKKGAIINIVSTAAKRAWANAAAYHASKWGLLGLSHAMHVEARAFGVKVTAIIAGGMRTPFLLDRFPDLDPAVLQDPASVAQAVKFALEQPEETVVPEITVVPMRETSWP